MTIALHVNTHIRRIKTKVKIKKYNVQGDRYILSIYKVKQLTHYGQGKTRS